jgi:hypothetical protein
MGKNYHVCKKAGKKDKRKGKTKYIQNCPRGKNKFPKVSWGTKK